MLTRAACLPVRYIWQISAAQILTDAERRCLGATVEQLSAAARRTLLDENGASINNRKTPAAKYTERCFFSLRIRDALTREATETSGGRKVGPMTFDFKAGREKGLHQFFRRAYEESDGYPLCGCELTTVLETDNSQSTTYGAVKSTNASMDRVELGRSGGLYVPSNLQVICFGCNTIKQHYSR